ncbi:MAG: threonine synthase, partial [Gemmatimonadetes bacterium]|nr:threonine synthase [Gemmatimonadota bacterium]NIR41447.1 threonine synthase [Actinomycetota bacterium]NIS36473.1 threonine synthase [Actinomycetota bacterium]NIT98716.1 threonine synthase [Actinomycetota bacterium]NIU70980.1 threonine synthase [Actinomycetota bacterium]
LAPAMDIQVPSNLERYLFELTGRDGDATEELVLGFRRHGAIVLDELSHDEMTGECSASWFDDTHIE